MFNYFGFITWILQLIKKYWIKLLLSLNQNANPNQRKLSVFRNEKTLREIPLVKGRPLVGTFFDLIAAGASPKLHIYIDQRHKQYGDIFRERLGGTQDAVFVSSASLMRSVFLYEGQHPKHPIPEAWELYNAEHNCQRGLFFMEGAEWWHNRRILNRFLLNGNLNWMDVHINDCTEKLINNWRRQAANVNDDGNDAWMINNLERQLYRWAIDIICAIMFGASSHDCPQLDAMLDNFSQIVSKIFETSASMMNFPAKLAKLFKLSIWTEFERNVKDVLEQGSIIIDNFVALNTKLSPDTEAEELIFHDTEVLFSKLLTAGMPIDMIKRIFVDLVIAAGDTTAYTTEWALYLLAQDDDLQQRMAKEINNLGYGNTPLVRGLLRETLRLYPVAPFIGRYFASDASIDSYHIKSNTLVLLSLYTAGRDPAHFPDPHAVKPERWQRNKETGMMNGVHEAHGTLPFAIGSRSCIGRKVAINQIQCFIAKIVSNFKLKFLNETPIDCILRLVTVPNPPLQLGLVLRDHI